MKSPIVSSLSLLALFGACSQLYAQANFGGTPSPTTYLNTERGLTVKHLKSEEISPSLQKGISPDKQIAKRTFGVATKKEILEREAKRLRGTEREWFASQPLKMMPYIDSSYVFGNTCIEPNALINEDPISTGSQKLKTALSDIGFTYSLQYGFNATHLTGNNINGRRTFVSHNGSLLSNLTLFRDNRTGSGFYVASEFDFGNGFGFNEGKKSPSGTLGSLQNPTASFQGPDPHLSNLSLAWVGANGKLLLMAGQLDTTNYMDHNAYANAHYNNLTNSVFSNNPMLPLTDNTLGFHFAYQPTESFYMMGAIAGNNVDQNQNPFKRFDSKNITAVTEFGYIIDDILGMGSGTYRLQPFWTKSNDKNGGGIGVNFQQQLGKNTHLGWFFRGGWASYQAAAVTGVRCAATTGIVYLSPFVGSGASNDSYLGLGFLWQQGATANGPYNNKNEYGMELTYVMQVTPTMTLQPDFQIIKDPVNGKKGQTAVVFQIQNVWSF